jgi:hypothetical protein
VINGPSANIWPYVPNSYTITWPPTYVEKWQFDALMQRVERLEKRMKRRPRRKKVTPE